MGITLSDALPSALFSPLNQSRLSDYIMLYIYSIIIYITLYHIIKKGSYEVPFYDGWCGAPWVQNDDKIIKSSGPHNIIRLSEGLMYESFATVGEI